MRTITVVTTARSDYGIYLPILRRIRDDGGLRLRLIVSGTHLAPQFGRTIEAIEADGFRLDERVESTLASDTPEGIAKSMALGLAGFAQAYARERPEILLLLGDRYDMYVAGLAALPFGIPVAHIHGGEVTVGAIDDALRHSLTKLSHVHFVTTEEHGRRVVQLGEDPWRVTVCGAPSLDNLRSVKLLSAAEMKIRHNLDVTDPPVVVTYHPVTLEYVHAPRQVEELIAAVGGAGRPVVVTMPNSDTGNQSIRRRLLAWQNEDPRVRCVESLGTTGYFSLMAHAAAMVGNSSSGIIEAASFRLPVVNVGTRQEGRARPANVLDVGDDRLAIAQALRRALSPAFRAGLAELRNPYGEGHAAEAIVERLKRLDLEDPALLKKRFRDTGAP